MGKLSTGLKEPCKIPSQTLLKLIYITLTHNSSTLHTPSAPQFTSYDTNSHETRTTHMTSQHKIESTILEYLRLTKHLKELGLDTVSKHTYLHTMFHSLTTRL
jgi:2,4-dienoyl-CoA reductase-like NADH-dependent reductase (Old Yellow Enzyme family)